MHIISDPKKDRAAFSKKPGGYEWWYFDAIDPASGYSFVVIFYQGNPFSGRYIQQLEQEGNPAKSGPEHFPAISISVYKNTGPVYYSFTEFDKSDCHFSTEVPSVKIGSHSLAADFAPEELRYMLNLQEELPSGDRIEAHLCFRSPRLASGAIANQEIDQKSKDHLWNLIQPRAEVTGSVRLFRDSTIAHDIPFNGNGYHDHNTGQEPMRDEFKDWYWGRFHFPAHTLVYYVMNRRQQQLHRAWLIGAARPSEIERFESIELRDKEITFFGLNSARKLVLESERSKIVVQQSHLLDNGPFYQRFLSDAFLSLNGRDIQKSRGISEYIHPERIHWKLFRPLVNMRMRYKNENPHWVQKSKKLYRWTW